MLITIAEKEKRMKSRKKKNSEKESKKEIDDLNKYLENMNKSNIKTLKSKKRSNSATNIEGKLSGVNSVPFANGRTNLPDLILSPKSSGVSGLTSHHRMHGNYNKNIQSTNLIVRDFETHGIQFNGFEAIVSDDVEIGTTPSKAFFNGEYRHMRR